MSDLPDTPDDASVALPTVGSLLGIDFGTKRIGVAVSDGLQSISSPLYNYNRGSLQHDEDFFHAVIAEYNAVGFVVGLPVHMSGDESKKSKEARKFAAWLTRRTGLSVDFQDERHSSIHAEALMMQANMSEKKRKERLDKVAAQIILDDYLRTRREKSETDSTAGK